jgi:hypothetical protein
MGGTGLDALPALKEAADGAHAAGQAAIDPDTLESTAAGSATPPAPASQSLFSLAERAAAQRGP